MKKFLLRFLGIARKLVKFILIPTAIVVVIVFHRETIIAISLGVTTLQFVAAITATIMQYIAVSKLDRMTADSVDMIGGWCLLGILSAAAFGYAQWTYLMSSPWAYLFPSTVVFAVIHWLLYWRWLHRRVVFYTEGCDYLLAREGSRVSSLQDIT